MKTAGLLLIVALTAVPLGGQPAWVGLAVSGSRTSFALRSGSAGSQWLGVGDEMGGWKVVAFRPVQELLVLQDRRGEVATVRLLDLPVQDLPSPEAQAMAAALLTVAARDGWTADATALPPQHQGAQYRVLVQRGAEARMVLLSEDGKVLDEWKV